MKLALSLAVVGLVASLVLAPRYRQGIDEEVFFDRDPARRAARGDEERSLGISLAGYEDLYAATGGVDALRGRIRAGILLGAVAIGQQGLEQMVQTQIDAYLERRGELDPDGKFLQDVLETWVQQRLHFDWTSQAGFYACSSTATCLAARGDPDGVAMLVRMAEQGHYYTEFFPYVRGRHPRWPAVEPLLRRYLEQGPLAARVEAGATLLDYYILFGVGRELWEEQGETIRAAFLKMRKRVLSFAQDPTTRNSGGTALTGIAMAGLLGGEKERRIITRDQPAAYGGHVDLMKMARLWIGLDKFEKYEQTTREYRDLDAPAKEYYYVAAAHRLAAIHRGLIEGRDGEREELTALVETAFDENATVTRRLALQTLITVEAEHAPEFLRRALNGRGALSIDAGALADDVKDPVALFLPAVRTPDPDYAALAAVSLLERLDGRALQR